MAGQQQPAIAQCPVSVAPCESQAEATPLLLSLFALPPYLCCLQLDSTVMDTALQAAVAQQQQDQAGKQQVEEEPVLALFVKDGMRGWVRASASDGKTRLHCPTQGVAAQLAQVRVGTMCSFVVQLDQDCSPRSGAPVCRVPHYILMQYAAEGRHRALVDFEQHLDDINANWLNTGLLEGPA